MMQNSIMLELERAETRSFYAIFCPYEIIFWWMQAHTAWRLDATRRPAGPPNVILGDPNSKISSCCGLSLPLIYIAYRYIISAPSKTICLSTFIHVRYIDPECRQAVSSSVLTHPALN
jgi:hypothetical protein